MTVTNCIVEANADDYYQIVGGAAVTGTTTLYCIDNEVVLPETEAYGVVDIDTSSIPDGDTITAATLYYYIHAYAATKFYSKIYTINLVGYGFIAEEKVFTATGWNNEVFTSAELAGIDKTGMTRFTFLIPEVDAGKYREMRIRAREYAPAGDYSCYLVVTHVTPSGQVIRTICS